MSCAAQWRRRSICCRREVTGDQLRRGGFREPVLVAAGRDAAPALGLRLPAEPLTARSIARAVGPHTKVHTINVRTQVPLPPHFPPPWEISS